jgi:hypothetical protein
MMMMTKMIHMEWNNTMMKKMMMTMMMMTKWEFLLERISKVDKWEQWVLWEQRLDLWAVN